MERKMEVTLETTFSARPNGSLHIAANLRSDDDSRVELSIYHDEEHMSHGHLVTSDARFNEAPGTRMEINYVEKCFEI